MQGISPLHVMRATTILLVGDYKASAFYMENIQIKIINDLK